MQRAARADARGEIDADAFEDLLTWPLWVGGHRDYPVPHSSGSVSLG